MPGDGKFWCTRTFTLGAPGTVPTGGEKIFEIIIERRNVLRLTIVTDEAMVVIDIP